MGVTRHSRVLSALEKRALRYRRKGQCQADMDEVLFNEAIDETGTVSTAGLTDSDNESLGNRIIEAEATYLEQEEIQGVSDDLLTIHGMAPGPKPEEVTRLIYENPDGFNTRINGNEKLDKAKELIDELEADVAAYSEHRINCGHKDNINGMGQMFNGGEAEIRTQTGHNKHENVGRQQQGGTSLLLFGSLIDQYNFEDSGKDGTGLGRWVVMTFQGSENIVTRIVCGYNPCRSPKKAKRSTYQQHRRYFTTVESDQTCPRKRFREDFIKQLEQWREAGDRLIVCMDANENIYRKQIGKILTNEEGLAMKEVVGEFTGQKLGATFFRGTEPIDGIWATSDVVVTNACVMPAGYGVGDHRLFIVDFLTSSLIGASPPRIVRAAARRLNTKIPGTAGRYSDKVEQQTLQHRVIERVGNAHETSRTKEEVKRKCDKIDVEVKQYMKGAEKRCRRIKSGRIPFSPESSKWIRRAQVYRSILRYHAGKIRNRGNLRRAARRCGISNPLGKSLYEVRAGLKECKKQCNYFRKHGHRYRRRHLKDRLGKARKAGNEEAEKRILEIIDREKQRSYWRRLNFSMQKQRGRSARVVSDEQEDGEVVEYIGQSAVEQAIWNGIHNKRFYLAEQAPICQGPMREAFGYLATTIAAKQVLAGTYNYPPDFDQATKEICESCARIRMGVPANSVKTKVSHGEWAQRWSKAKEKTSSSESGLHFGHYKAAAQSSVVSHLHALKTSLALKRGFALERWSRGLSVMLEKMFGCTLVSKLRAILLMEADFNFSNKLIYGVRMMNNVRKHDWMPEEIYSEKGKTADDGTLAKVLFYDIVRQSRVSAGLSSIDAANCYDSIAHAIASLVFQAFGVPEEAIESMLTAIQDMKYFLRTAYGDSTHCAGSTIELKFQGLCQGNGAAPAGWAVISITILDAHKRKGHGGHFVCPISNLSGHLAAILFVDDTDILHIDLRGNQTVHEAHSALQESIYNWGQLLIATGGAFKPPKCFFHLLSFVWSSEGKWSYANNEDNDEYEISVPMPNGSYAPIEHLSVDTAKETLGVFSCPSGKAKGQIKAMQTKAQEWIDRAKEGKLRRRDVWFLLEHQLWPKVGYGISSLSAPWKELDGCLRNKWWQIVPMGGLIRTAPREVRDMDIGFYGAGCPHVGIECLTAQVNKLLMHYGSRSNDGLKLKMSLEYIILELGMSVQPLQTSYEKYGDWVTSSWIKSLWEKCAMFSVRVEFGDVPIELPRDGDQWLMKLFEAAGFCRQDLIRLNRVRIYQQVLFLSEILGASGKMLDRKYLRKRPEAEKWSCLNYPNEKPPRKDFTLWATAIQLIVPADGIMDRLGRFNHEEYKIWPWRYDSSAERLLHRTEEGIEVYGKATQARTRSSTQWELLADAQPIEFAGKICTVRGAGQGRQVIISTASAPRQKQMPSTILEVLSDWGSTWMWKSLRLIGEDHWLEEAIAAGTCVAVTDGSYIKEYYSNICSAAFVFECTEGRGRIVGSFPEQSVAANAYRGELLGLMAIHLILLAANRVNPELQGSVNIVSDCLGALDKVANLPPNRIPTRCKHSDILKNIMINCTDLTFDLHYSHVRAHQDDSTLYALLSRPAQLNCNMDINAKRVIWGLDGDELPPQEVFPLEAVSVFVGQEKMTSDTSDSLRFWAHQQLARATFFKLDVMSGQSFQEVAWRPVYDALHDVPRLFQLWACKQVMDVAGTNLTQSYYTDNHDPHCPSCSQEVESCDHVLRCNEAGRVDALLRSIGWLDDWLKNVGTEPTLRKAIVKYARGRDSTTMEDITWGWGLGFREMGRSQDAIGWRRFMEGMFTKEMMPIQADFVELGECTLSLDKWAQGLVVKLLEVTHGQWLYRNVHVHDAVTGAAATARKEEIQQFIEDQIELGEEGLDASDYYLLEVNLEDLETTSGEEQHYWLLQIQAARRDFQLRRNRNQNGNQRGPRERRA